jgi:hypothetical protein
MSDPLGKRRAGSSAMEGPRLLTACSAISVGGQDAYLVGLGVAERDTSAVRDVAHALLSQQSALLIVQTGIGASPPLRIVRRQFATASHERASELLVHIALCYVATFDQGSSDYIWRNVVLPSVRDAVRHGNLASDDWAPTVSSATGRYDAEFALVSAILDRADSDESGAAHRAALETIASMVARHNLLAWADLIRTSLTRDSLVSFLTWVRPRAGKELELPCC